MRPIGLPSSSGCTARATRRSTACRWATDTPGVKVATEQTLATTTADAVDRRVTEAETAATYEAHVRGRLRGLQPTTAHQATCLYTSLPEGRFVVDRHPTLDGVTVVSACSGHGFKHAAAIGEAVADSLLGRAPRVDLAPFAWARIGTSEAC